jgi:hypothetical protein
MSPIGKLMLHQLSYVRAAAFYLAESPALLTSSPPPSRSIVVHLPNLAPRVGAARVGRHLRS